MPCFCPHRLFLLSGALLSFHADAAPLRTAYYESPPTSYIQDKQITGVCPDLLQAISKLAPQLQFRGQKQMTSLIAVETRLQNGSYDVACGLARTPQRESYSNFQGKLFTIEHKVLVRQDDNINISSLAELASLSVQSPVIVRRGSVFASWLKQHGVTVDDSSDSNEINLRKLALGRGRFYYSADYHLKRQRDQYHYQSQTRLLPTAFYSQPVFLVTAKTLAASQRQQLDNAFEELQRNGTLERIRRKYGIHETPVSHATNAVPAPTAAAVHSVPPPPAPPPRPPAQTAPAHA